MWKSGHVYSFKYNAWENDPEPLIILMYSLEGTHPKTGRQWRFFQGINLSYVPRNIRKQFANTWIKEFEKRPDNPQNIRFTYLKMKRRYPGLLGAVRRYMHTPKDRIQKPREIPIQEFQKALNISFAKDFSRKARSIFKKLRKGKLFQRKKTKGKKKPRSLRKI